MSFNPFHLIITFFLSILILFFWIPIIFGFYKLFCLLSTTLVLAWCITNFIYEHHSSSQTISPNDRAVLITGCDSGFGNQLAKQCDKLGFHVFAGVLNPDQFGAQELKTVCSQNLRIVKMDVTKFEDVVYAINQIKLSGIQLWAVVNNAGISISTPIEWGYDVNQLDQIFSVNVMGAVRVTKLSLPLLRQSKGRIINISSIAGRITVPGITFYSMSKHAIRSFSNGLRKEIKSLGIKVINIEPVLYRTSISDPNVLKINFDKVWEQTPEDVKSCYNQNFKNHFIKRVENFSKTARKQTEEVIDVLVRAMTQKEPRSIYKCGGIVDYITVFPLSYFPEPIQEFVNENVFKNQLIGSIYQMLTNKL